MKLRAPNYAEVASTLALTLALGTGGAYAASLVTGDDIAKSAITTKHIKNGTVKEKDLSSTVKSKFGTPGAQGPAGATGPRGLSAWDTIPSGLTVRGQEYEYLRGIEGVINVTLPGIAPSELTDATVNFAGTSPVTNDDDPTCTGTFANPTAPAGKVCIYSGFLGNAAFAKGYTWSEPTVRTRSFYVEYTTSGSGDVNDVWFTWAYTAP